MSLPSTKPYLIRAIHEWCCDNGFTPYLAVSVDARTRVPMEFVRDGQIVLNVGPDATNRLSMGNDLITFQARFGGVARDISVPISNVAAIYSRENGAGMAFEPEDEAGVTDPAVEPTEPSPEPPSSPPATTRPKLQRVK
ncbi:MAG: ClpXP protease specificity-enhancing factor [Betaproteobacteria bacterium]|uniref:ClpXP protease specificity-enhancing factor n=1 Tax=Candidatus Proximibacter danicus TaxID=2954365 RepID=A0A9D7JYA1_9PROT|nr:ClpXP protease specificity-enhancing factor [Candidatus Proximibacter danicus]MBK9446548.1 ClpXP protease specificity-enhancing factor [Betaproteobacteria bacterium]